MARPITNDCVRAAVLGTGRYLPEGTLSNHDLEKLVATSDEWIVTRTGIHNRHIAIHLQKICIYMHFCL